MAKHVLEKIKLSDDTEISSCIICKGSGSMLTADCCGRELTKDEKVKIFSQELDYREGKWRIYAKVF